MESPPLAEKRRVNARARYASDSVFREAAKERSRRWGKENRDDSNRRANLWNADHPEERRAAKRRDHLHRSYGINSEQYDRLLAKQGGRCALCNSEKFALCIDHDHVTGRVRGLLCQICNKRLGDLEDPAFTEAARRYLLEPPFTG